MTLQPPAGKTLRTYSPTDPGAGNPLIYQPPYGVSWDILAISCRLTTAVAVANRMLYFNTYWGGAVCSWTYAGNIQLASSAIDYIGQSGFYSVLPLTAGNMIFGMPTPMPANNNSLIQIGVDNMQGADALTLITLQVLESIEV
jgi:hypothetical protein